MSSALRTVSQIEPTVKFLRRLTSSTATIATLGAMDSFLGNASNTTIASTNGINTVVKATTTPTTTTTTSLLVRDMGRRVTVVHPDTAANGNLVRQVWIHVQPVDNLATEGVSTSRDSFWIRTFSHAGEAVEFARIG
jgi:hypothetical protein